MNDVRRSVHQALAEVKTVDPHCHLRPEKPSADNLADILLYHHVWIELVSSGMPQRAVSRVGLPQEIAEPEVPALERVRRCLPYLASIEATTCGLFLRWILHDLYGLERLTEANLEAAFRLVEERGGSREWQEGVLRERCGIEASISVERGGAPHSPTLFLGREGLPINIVDGKRSPREVLTSMEALLGREIRSAYDYRELLQRLLRERPLDELKFVGLWPLPYLTPQSAREQEMGRILARAAAGEPLSPDEAGSFSYYAMTSVLEEMRRSKLRVVQVIVGAEVLPPHRALTHWSGEFPGAMARIANLYQDFHFNLASASDLYTQDLGILAKHFPNISVAGYWWHTLYPFYIRKSLESRLDMVPINKIIGYFSDAYHSEWCYPKLKMVKQVVEGILVERVERGWYTLDTALEVVGRLFHRNAKEIYGP